MSAQPTVAVDAARFAGGSAELDRQIDNLLRLGYPKAAGLNESEFVSRVAPLRTAADDVAAIVDRPEAVRVPFVLVVTRDLVVSDKAIGLVRRRGQAASSVLGPDELARFLPIAEVTLPPGAAYLITDVDTGNGTLNATPDEALVAFGTWHRSPLTIEEGIALVTHYPEAVAPNAGFSLLGSRCGDRRVSALWISKGRPKLGWCWAGAPHTWLGSASCAARVGL